MNDDWMSTSLGEVVDIQFGNAFKSAEFSDAENGIRLLRGDNVAQGYVRWNGAKFWPAARSSEVEQYLLQESDVVLAMDRPWIEAGLKYAQIRRKDLPSLLVQRVARLRGKPEIDQRFLRWVIGSSQFTKHVIGVQTGTAVPHISGDQIRSHRFHLPPIEEQRLIAGVLGALDDLVDINEQIIQQVRALSALAYRRAKVGTEATARLGDVAAVNPRQTRASSGGSLVYLDIASLGDGSIEWPLPIAWSEAPSRARRLADPGSTIWSTVRPNRRAHALLMSTPKDLVLSTGLAVLTPHSIGPAELFAATNENEFVDYLMTRAEGSAYPAVRPVVFEEAQIARLSPDSSEEFEARLWPLWQMAGALDEENRELRCARDELLPLLMSGKIRVRDLQESSV